jgi:hypothetical protein
VAVGARRAAAVCQRGAAAQGHGVVRTLSKKKSLVLYLFQHLLLIDLNTM